VTKGKFSCVVVDDGDDVFLYQEMACFHIETRSKGFSRALMPVPFLVTFLYYLFGILPVHWIDGVWLAGHCVDGYVANWVSGVHDGRYGVYCSQSKAK